MGFPCQISEFLAVRLYRDGNINLPRLHDPEGRVHATSDKPFWPSLYTTRLDVRSDGRRGPQVCKVAVVPQDEFGEDDVLDDGVEQEVRQSDEAPEDGAEEEA